MAHFDIFQPIEFTGHIVEPSLYARLKEKLEFKVEQQRIHTEINGYTYRNGTLSSVVRKFFENGLVRNLDVPAGSSVDKLKHLHSIFKDCSKPFIHSDVGELAHAEFANSGVKYSLSPMTYLVLNERYKGSKLQALVDYLFLLMVDKGIAIDAYEAVEYDFSFMMVKDMIEDTSYSSDEDRFESLMCELGYEHDDIKGFVEHLEASFSLTIDDAMPDDLIPACVIDQCKSFIAEVQESLKHEVRFKKEGKLISVAEFLEKNPRYKKRKFNKWVKLLKQIESLKDWGDFFDDESGDSLVPAMYCMIVPSWSPINQYFGYVDNMYDQIAQMGEEITLKVGYQESEKSLAIKESIQAVEKVMRYLSKD